MGTSLVTLTNASVMVPLDRIPTDEKRQTRVKIRAGVVREYAAAMTAQLEEGGLRFPPVILFTDAVEYWLGDGFHRVLAARLAGLTEIAANLRPGGERDAMLYAIGANAGHGLPRTRADKHRAVALVLADLQWSQWSDREIGRRCQVDGKVVSRMRRRLSAAKPQIAERKARRGDTVYEMNVNRNRSAIEADSAPAARLTDALGITVPEPRAAVFAGRPEFQKTLELFDRLAEAIDRVAQSPAGAAYRQDLTPTNIDGGARFVCSAVRAGRDKLAAAEPYCVSCPICHGKQRGPDEPECSQCGGRGWVTRAGWESCLDVYRQGFLTVPLLRPANQPPA